jgi:hypothetical protein
MSIRIAIETSQKQELANIIRDIVDMIESSSNDRISVTLEVNFKSAKKVTE